MPTTARSSALSKLAEHATFSGAEPTTGRRARLQGHGHAQARRGTARLRPRSHGTPRTGFRCTSRSRAGSSPRARPRRHGYHFGATPACVHITPPAGAKVVDLGSGHSTERAARRGQDAAGDRRFRPRPFTLAAPDTLVGLPRTDVRLISDAGAALVTYGQGLGGIAVIERRDQARRARRQPARNLPAVSIGGATGHELPTPLGTLVAWQRGGASYTLVGSLPPNAAEAAPRADWRDRGPSRRADSSRPTAPSPPSTRRPHRRAGRRLTDISAPTAPARPHRCGSCSG